MQTLHAFIHAINSADLLCAWAFLGSTRALRSLYGQGWGRKRDPGTLGPWVEKPKARSWSCVWEGRGGFLEKGTLSMALKDETDGFIQPLDSLSLGLEIQRMIQKPIHIELGSLRHLQTLLVTHSISKTCLGTRQQ